MIRQICYVQPENVATVRSNKLLALLEIDDLNIILREKRLHWLGHIEQSSGAITTVCGMQIEGKCGPGQPKMTWTTNTEIDPRELKLNEVDPFDRVVWRSSMGSDMRSAS